MKLVVFGATGPTGQLVVKKALDAGHQVTAVARSPSKVVVLHPQLRVARADVSDAGSLESCIAGHDAVLSCIGSSRIVPPVTVFSAGMRHVLAGMTRAGVRRIVVVSSGGTSEGRNPDSPFVFERILKPIVYRFPYADMRAMEQIIMASDSDWTVLRPPRLVDRPESGATLQARGAFTIQGKYTLTRRDLATVILATSEDPSSIREAIAVAGA